MSAAIRAAIVAKLNAIPGIGTVNAYQRYADDMRDLEAMYVDDGVLHGWFVRRLTVKEEAHSRGRNVETTQWLVHGYMAINDAAQSELAFDALLDAVRDAFRYWPPLPGLGLLSDLDGGQAGIAVTESAPVLFAGVLCHSASCLLVTRRHLSTKA